MALVVLGSNIGTFFANARIGDFPEALAHELEERKVQSQEAEEDFSTRFVFAGETLDIKPHGAGRDPS